MALIFPAATLWGGHYKPWIQADGLLRGSQEVVLGHKLLAVFSRPIEQGEEIEWVRVGRAPNGVIVLDPGPFGEEDVEDPSRELLLIRESSGGRRDNYLVVEGPRLATAEFDGFRWQRASFVLAPAGWAEAVAARFRPGKDGLRQVFTLPQA